MTADVIPSKAKILGGADMIDIGKYFPPRGLAGSLTCKIVKVGTKNHGATVSRLNIVGRVTSITTT
jgi:hypothetical protein